VVSWFDPVTVERFAQLFPFRIRVNAFALRSAMGLPLFRGTACGLAAFGPLAGGSEVDDFSHSMFRRSLELRGASFDLLPSAPNTPIR
jgi:hypothetical protein